MKVARIGILLVLGLLVAMAVGYGFERWREATLWQAMQQSHSMADANAYELQIPAFMQRPGYPALKLELDAYAATGVHSAYALDDIIDKVQQHHASDPAWQPALQQALKGRHQAYAFAAQQMEAGKGSADLQKAMATLLRDPAVEANHGKLYLAFNSAAELDPPPGDAAGLAAVLQNPQVHKDYPKGDAPVLSPGDAFSVKRDEWREKSILNSLSAVFFQVVSGSVIRLEALPPGQSLKGRPGIEVSSRIRRLPYYFVYSVDDKCVGLVFGIESVLSFRVIEPHGEVLFASEDVTTPASKVSFKTSAKDPLWAPYAIVVDSSHYNFSRQLVAAFGVPPDPERTEFEFQNPGP